LLLTTNLLEMQRGNEAKSFYGVIQNNINLKKEEKKSCFFMCRADKWCSCGSD